MWSAWAAPPLPNAPPPAAAAAPLPAGAAPSAAGAIAQPMQYTAAQFAAMSPEQQFALQAHWQQWQKYQEEYAKWHAQYGEQYNREMAAAATGTATAVATTTSVYPAAYAQPPLPPPDNTSAASTTSAPNIQAVQQTLVVANPAVAISGQPQIYAQPPLPALNAANQFQQQQANYNQPPPPFNAQVGNQGGSGQNQQHNNSNQRDDSIQCGGPPNQFQNQRNNFGNDGGSGNVQDNSWNSGPNNDNMDKNNRNFGGNNRNFGNDNNSRWGNDRGSGRNDDRFGPNQQSCGRNDDRNEPWQRNQRGGLNQGDAWNNDSNSVNFGPNRGGGPDQGNMGNRWSDNRDSGPGNNRFGPNQGNNRGGPNQCNMNSNWNDRRGGPNQGNMNNNWNDNFNRGGPNQGNWNNDIGGGNFASNRGGGNQNFGNNNNMNQGNWGNRGGPNQGQQNRAPELDEEGFDRLFRQWEQQFEDWKKANANNPDREMYNRYEMEFEKQRRRLIERRDQMRRRKLEQTGGISTPSSTHSSIQPHTENKAATNEPNKQLEAKTEYQAVKPIEQSPVVEKSSKDDEVGKVDNQTLKEPRKRKSRFDTPTDCENKLSKPATPPPSEVINLDDDDDEQDETPQNLEPPTVPIAALFKKTDGIPGLDLVDESSTSKKNEREDINTKAEAISSSPAKKIPSLFDVVIQKPFDDSTPLKDEPPATDGAGKVTSNIELALTSALPDIANSLKDPEFMKKITDALAKAQGKEVADTSAQPPQKFMQQLPDLVQQFQSRQQGSNNQNMSFSDWQRQRSGNDFNDLNRFGPNNQNQNFCGPNFDNNFGTDGGRFGQNFGGNDGRFGPNNGPNFCGPNGPNDGPFGNRFGPNNGPNFGGPNNRFGTNDGPMGGRFGNNDGPMCGRFGNNNFGPDGGRFGNRNDGKFGPNIGPNFNGPNGPNDGHFGNRFGGPNNGPNFGGPNNRFGNNNGPMGGRFGNNGGANSGGGFGNNDGPNNGGRFGQQGRNFGGGGDGPNNNRNGPGTDDQGNMRQGGQNRSGSVDKPNVPDQQNTAKDSASNKSDNENKGNTKEAVTAGDEKDNTQKANNANNPFRRIGGPQVPIFDDSEQKKNTNAPWMSGSARNIAGPDEFYRPMKVIDYQNTSVAAKVIDYGHRPSAVATPAAVMTRMPGRGYVDEFRPVKTFDYGHASTPNVISSATPAPQMSVNAKRRNKRKNKNKNNANANLNANANNEQQNNNANTTNEAADMPAKAQSAQNDSMESKNENNSNSNAGESESEQKEQPNANENKSTENNVQTIEFEEISDSEEDLPNMDLERDDDSPPPPPPPMFSTNNPYIPAKQNKDNQDSGACSSIFPSTAAANENIKAASAKHLQMSVPSIENQNTILIDEIVMTPGRQSRPKKICIILRGPPGSGKSHMARLIKEKECEMGGTNSRILSIDDYFLIENDYEEKCPKTGKMIPKKEILYEYDKDMEATYTQYLIKLFKKTIADNLYDFIIIDCNNSSLRTLNEFYCHAKDTGFVPYIVDLLCDLETCMSRNIHERTEKDMKEILKNWNATPFHYIKLDCSTLLENLVEMEDAEDMITENISDEEAFDDENVNPSNEESGEAADEKQTKYDNASDVEEVAEEDSNDAGEDATLSCAFLKSKWDDSTTDNLARLDGTNKLKDKRKTTMEDYLQIDDWEPPKTSKEGKKRVRWADIEEKRAQEKMRAIGFVVGQTDWKRMMDPNAGNRALNRTKYIERNNRRGNFRRF